MDDKINHEQCIFSIEKNTTQRFHSNDVSSHQNISLIHFKDLMRAKHVFQSHFNIQLANGQMFFADQVLRFVTKKRLIAFGHWEGRSVVAKIYFQSKNAKRDFEKEVSGVTQLLKHQILTPQLFYQGTDTDKRIYILLFERIMNANTLLDVWKENTAEKNQLPLLQLAVQSIAQQHHCGVLQRDVNLGNYLIADNHCYTIDGLKITVCDNPVSKELSLNFLAMFFSWFGFRIAPYQEILFAVYAKTRGWTINQTDVDQLYLLIKKWHDVHWKRRKKQIFENSAKYARIKKIGVRGMFDRSYAYSEFMQFLNNPEKIFSKINANEMIDCSQWIVRLDASEFIVQRYKQNRFLKMFHSKFTVDVSALWKDDQKKKFFCIDTKKPAAFIKMNKGLYRYFYYVIYSKKIKK